MADGVLTPAYSRDYATVNGIFAHWLANKDFVYLNPTSPYNGKYINKSDAENAKLTSFEVRYNKNKNCTMLEYVDGKWIIGEDSENDLE